MELTIDFETRSTVDIRKCGGHRYACHPSTEIMCLGIKAGDDDTRLWVPDKFRKDITSADLDYALISTEELNSCIRHSDGIHVIAHNAQFEFDIWNKVGTRSHNWPFLSLPIVYDTMAQAAYHALPLGLGDCAKALGLSAEKDTTGNRIMLKLCKPRKPRKHERLIEEQTNISKIYWHDDRSDLIALFNYCGKDVDVTRLIYNTLPKLPDYEQKIWELTAAINLNGIQVDYDNILIIMQAINDKENELVQDFSRVTGGRVPSPRSYVALKEWINEAAGLQLESIGKRETNLLLKKIDRLPPKVQEVLKIKAELSKSSTAKFSAMVGRCDSDKRIRGTAIYHGATTGRWAARGVQIHNLQRDSFEEKEWDDVLTYMRNGDITGLEETYGPVFSTASKLVRGSLCSSDGKVLMCSDFSSIEGRVLAYIAGEDAILHAYKEGFDMYKVTASMMLSKPYDAVTKDERNTLGKIAELACGYQGSVGAIRAFGGGSGMTDPEVVEKIVKPWRFNRAETVKLWYKIEDIAKLALKNPGLVTKYNGIKYCYTNDFLKCKLPSGRLLHYYKPEIQALKTKFGTIKPTITFEGRGFIAGKTISEWTRVNTYGGKLVENIVQGISRDILAEAMLRLHKAGFFLIGHVHDEIIAEANEKTADLERFETIMAENPHWCYDLPLACEGWVGKRYKK